MDKLKVWFDGLPPKKKKLVYVGAAFAVIVILGMIF